MYNVLIVSDVRVELNSFRGKNRSKKKKKSDAFHYFALIATENFPLPTLIIINGKYVRMMYVCATEDKLACQNH